MPYVNQEDLAKPETLLLLLNSRGRNHPSAFAAADGQAMHLGFVTMAVVPIFLNCYVMTLNGMTQEKEYGRLIAWEDHEDAFDWMSTRKQFMPGEGLLILEAQARLLEFLVCCCQQILHDIEEDELLDDKYPVLPEPQPNENDSNGGVTSLAFLSETAPYRPPAKLDLEKIESILAARVSSAEDHVWALREDPGYFGDQILERKEHRQEMLLDVCGNRHPTLKPLKQELFWARVIGGTLSEASMQLEMFTELHDQAYKLRALQKKYHSAISPVEDLPAEYLDALLKFRHYLRQLAKGYCSQLKTAVAASPPMRAYFVRQIPVSGTSSKINVMSKPGMQHDKIFIQLLWLLRTLWEDGKDLLYCGMPLLVDELERLLNAEQEARDLVSSHVAMLVGELSIVAECLRQLEIYQPWANGFDNAWWPKEKGIQEEFAARTTSAAQVIEAFRDTNLLHIIDFGDPSDNKFDYPVNKRRSQANNEKLRAAEHNLDVFWKKIDDHLKSRLGNQVATTLKLLPTKPRPLQRTPEWSEKPSTNIQKSEKKSHSELDAQTDNFANMHLDSKTSARKELLTADGPKSKVKSRGTPSSDATNRTFNETDSVQTPEDKQPLFSVDKRALKVFRAIFFDPSGSTTPGEVPWIDFLHAMTCTGFGAQKLYGSVWHFQPTRLDVERSIQFHEPHPHHKIPFLVARRHGRRLNRAYGWVGSMFVLAN